MRNKYYGYIRVSTADQNDARQRIELEKQGIEKRNIYTDKVSGKDFNRPAYQRLKKRLKQGDVVFVKSLDRLGRNYVEIQEEWRYITKVIEADIVILDMPLLDTRSNKDLIGMLISDIVLQIISYVAQIERENIKQRQSEGIAAAKARGKHLGRPKKPTPNGFENYYPAYIKGTIPLTTASRKLGISEKEFLWFVNREKRHERLSG